jgi:lipopolysaccharide cholinephosphotransferase
MPDLICGSGGRESRYCTIPTGRKSYNGEALPKDVFFPPVQALFEGITVHIPRSAGTYLQNLYGDYMQIPPPEKRERHFYTAFSLDTAKDA